jgi:hypothetical protein
VVFLKVELCLHCRDLSIFEKPHFAMKLAASHPRLQFKIVSHRWAQKDTDLRGIGKFVSSGERSRLGCSSARPRAEYYGAI